MQRVRARELRLADLPEQVLYERYQLILSDSDGIARVAYRCPVASSNSGAVRATSFTRAPSRSTVLLGQGLLLR